MAATGRRRTAKVSVSPSDTMLHDSITNNVCECFIVLADDKKEAKAQKRMRMEFVENGGKGKVAIIQY